MRRRAPRRLSAVLEGVTRAVVPTTLLARVQTAWPEVAGPALAAAAAPVSARDGVITVACESAVWAQELELLSQDLVARLNERTRAAGAGVVSRLRFVVRSAPN